MRRIAACPHEWGSLEAVSFLGRNIPQLKQIFWRILWINPKEKYGFKACKRMETG